jgi:hypothetical protein
MNKRCLRTRSTWHLQERQLERLAGIGIAIERNERKPTRTGDQSESYESKSPLTKTRSFPEIAYLS